MVPINEELIDILHELKPKTLESTFVLPRLKDWRAGHQAMVLKAFCESIEIKPIRFHSITLE